MKTMNATRTDEVLAAMLTENTGANILDSGGAYGRNWERNQGRDVDSFLSSPAVRFDAQYADVTLSVFHHLRDKLSYAAEEDNYFHQWAKDKDDYWLSLMDEYAEFRGWEIAFSENSYNRDSHLSQVIQYTVYDSGLVALQIHGGCDVRGGYTAPRIFAIDDPYDLALESVAISCNGEAVDSDGPHWFENRPGDDWCAVETGDRVDSPYEWTKRRDLLKLDYLPCPTCGAPMRDGAQ